MFDVGWSVSGMRAQDVGFVCSRWKEGCSGERLSNPQEALVGGILRKRSVVQCDLPKRERSLGEDYEPQSLLNHDVYQTRTAAWKTDNLSNG
jgi:hypothetical protein